MMTFFRFHKLQLLGVLSLEWSLFYGKLLKMAHLKTTRFVFGILSFTPNFITYLLPRMALLSISWPTMVGFKNNLGHEKPSMITTLMIFTHGDQ